MVTEQIANLSTGNRRPGSSPGLSAFASLNGASADSSAVFLSFFQSIRLDGVFEMFFSAIGRSKGLSLEV